MVDLPLHVGPGVCLCLVLVGATRLVLDSLLAVVVVARVCVCVCLPLSDCMPSPGQGGQMALSQHPPYDPACKLIMECGQITTATPHAFHTHTLPIGSVGDPARQMSGTRRQAPTRVSTPIQMVAAGGAGSEALLCQGSGLHGGGGVGKV